MRFRKLFVTLVVAAATARADSILVLNSGVQGNVGVVQAISDLANLGHSVTTGGTLADYSSFDQVWDLRYNANFVLDDLAAFSNYLAAGGRLYLAGENPSFDLQRNLSLRGLLFALGAGDVAYSSEAASNTQTFTAAGALLNTPNTFSSIAYLGARGVASGGTGFLVTESLAGAGSMVAWDFGDIAGAPDARMIALWDIDVFRTTTGNGVGWVENVATYLGTAPPMPQPVPEPSSVLLTGAGLAAVWVLRRRLAYRSSGHRE
jgi:hypothetical protein